MGRRGQVGGPTGSGSRGERGAALIEAALVFILLVALLLGTVTAGIAYGRFNALQAAAREASRFGATLPVSGSVDTWLDEVRDVAKAAALGELGASTPGQYVCVALLGPPGTPRRLEESAGSDAFGNTECFADGRPAAENRTQVMVRRDTELLVAYFSTDITLTGQAATRYER